MTRRPMDMLRAVWRSTNSLVALVLIVLAFVVGWSLRGGGGDDGGGDPDAATADAGGPTLYTCSMHPQIRLPDPEAKCPICFMDLIPVVDDGSDGSAATLVMSAAAMKLAEIETTPVVRRFPPRTVRLFGKLDFDETRIATIAAYYPGRLERLFVDYTGMRVRTGDHLVQIYSPELSVAHTELRQAIAASAEAAPGGSAERMAAAKLAASREKLRLWGMTDTQITALEERADTVTRTTIYAPISGVVIHKGAVEGDYVRTGDEIFRLAELDHLWVRLEAYESQLPWLRYGQDVTFTTDALPGRSFTGRISFIDPVVRDDTRTVRVRLNVDNAGGILKPGMFVRAAARSRVSGAGPIMDAALAGKWISPMHPEIVKDGPGTCDVCGMDLVPAEELGFAVATEDAEPPLVIPVSAPLITGRRAVVYVRVPDAERPTFEGREIVLGPRADHVYIVESGLDEGEDVVVRGAFKIDSAMQIAAKPSMMSPADAESVAVPAPAELTLPEDFIFSLKPLYSAYFTAQEALAADDLGRFRRGAGDARSAMEFVEAETLAGEARGRWVLAAADLATAMDGLDGAADIAAARVRFEHWSTAMIAIERTFGHAGARAHFVTHCPMAFDNRGASWLAREATIANPYFGASMLRCGTIEDEHAPRDPGGAP